MQYYVSDRLSEARTQYYVSDWLSEARTQFVAGRNKITYTGVKNAGVQCSVPPGK